MPRRPLVLIATVLVLAGCTPAAPPEPLPAPTAVAQVDAAPRLAVAVGPGISGVIDPEWSSRMARATGIPERALLAYAGAAISANEFKPGCGIGWNTIAAVGEVESDHARHDGSTLDASGTAVPPIFGVALTGGETARIVDSDGGAIDGDAEYDRAVGPMQLIPQSWSNWATDGNGDGVNDPQNIDDAAFAAANYLCRASDNRMSEPEGWLVGIAAYNSAEEYLRAVAVAAQRYLDAATSLDDR